MGPYRLYSPAISDGELCPLLVLWEVGAELGPFLPSSHPGKYGQLTALVARLG